MHKNCRGCIHKRKLSWALQEFACHYSLDTGELRGVPACECTVKCTDKKMKEKYRKKAIDESFQYHKLLAFLKKYNVFQ